MDAADRDSAGEERCEGEAERAGGEAASSGTSAIPDAIPSARLRKERRWSLVWLLPAGALLLAAWLVVAAIERRGTIVTVQFPQGHGLEVGDEVRTLGIAVGVVRDLELEHDAGGVTATIALHAGAETIARTGSRFWIVRPRLALTGIEGLETVIGPRYVRVVSGVPGAPARRDFVGLAEAPVVEAHRAGDLEIVLTSSARGSVRPGAPLLYRQVRVGTVISVGLASDGGAVESRVHVEQAAAQLVREGSRFWDSGRLSAEVSLTGARLRLDSIEALLAGGVSFATPPLESAGGAVRTGHRFDLEPEPEDEWLEWRPAVAVGSDLLPPESALPRPLRAALGWKHGLFRTERTLRGWVIETRGGLLGPADLLAWEPGARLEVAGREVVIPDVPTWTNGILAAIDATFGESVWPMDSIRSAGAVEDCLAIGDPSAAPLPLAASRLEADERTWRVDPALSIDESWHGACVLSRADGKLVGVLLVGDEGARVALVPPSFALGKTE